MSVFGKKKSRRTVEPPRLTPSWGRKLADSFGGQVPYVQALIALGFIVAVSAICFFGGQRLPWQEDQRPDQDILVRASFTAEDKQQTRENRSLAAESTPNHFRLNRSFLAKTEADLLGIHEAVRSVETPDALSAELKKVGIDWQIDKETFEQFKNYANEAGTQRYRDWLNVLINNIRDSAVISKVEAPYDRTRATECVLLGPNNASRTVRLWVYPGESGIEQVLKQITSDPIDEPVSTLFQRYLKRQLRPVYVFDAKATEEARLERRSNPEHIAYLTYNVGDVLVTRGEKIDAETLELLKAEHDAYQASISERQRFMTQAGLIALVAMLTVAMAFYTTSYEHRAVHNWSRTLALGLVFVLMIALSRAVVLTDSPAGYMVFPITFAAATVTIAYRRRFALGMMAVLGSMIIIAVRGDFGLFLILMSAAVTTVLGLREIRTRSRVLQVGLVSAVAALLTSIAVGSWQGHGLDYIREVGLAAAISAVAMGFVVQGLLPLIERWFRIATSMTLLEWCDANRPLLKRLAIEAPGTYTHSLLLGSMAEAAAESVGANGLLARVGAYYHDIGKMNKPQYFVENQPTLQMSRHGKLSPGMSLLIIIGHVKDGLEMAREYGLPRVLHPFISEHHGTTLVQYFYNQANKNRKPDDRELSDSEFRYPGPKPQTKETAVLMLCDGVEGAVRAMEEPTAGRIENAVHQMIQARLGDGQFDDCGITLKELHTIGQSLTRSLCALHHNRISYKKNEPEKEPATGGATSAG